jgi:hypothetical protein
LFCLFLIIWRDGNSVATKQSDSKTMIKNLKVVSRGIDVCSSFFSDVFP